MRATRPKDEDGFTLIELLVVLTVSSVVIGALVYAMFTTAHNTAATNAHFARSHDAQIFGNYLTADAEGAVGTSASTAHVTANGTACVPAGQSGTSVLRLGATRTSTTFGTTTVTVNYVLGTDNRLTRWKCDGTTSTSNVVGHAVADVVATCKAGTTTQACAAGSTGLTVTVTSTTDNGDFDASNAYTYALNASFRAAYAPSPTATPTPYQPPAGGFPIIALGNSTTSPSFSLSGNASVTLPPNAAVATNGYAYYQGSPSLDPASTSVNAGGACQGNKCSNLGSRYKSPAGVVGDPYYGLATPTSSTSRTGCGSTHAASPGTYAATLSISGNCVLQPGVYVLQNGLDVGNGNVTCASTCSAGGESGVVFVVTGGSVDVGNGSVAVPKYGGTNAPTMHGFVVFQPRTNTNAMSFHGNGAFGGTGASDKGIIYAPATTFGYNGTVDLNVSQLIVNDLANNGNASLDLS
ncbi:MAG: prepilin-type N-terminal cleavage/methylation domain-containing protein [Jatrophihabitans sp.]|uniref:prepilin-type N-terminal cleavage/methylation domain-containing protein n=1 Tax=Jatrophihabitans sp. TaxID=1932789 RepID=UPI003F7EC815